MRHCTCKHVYILILLLLYILFIKHSKKISLKNENSSPTHFSGGGKLFCLGGATALEVNCGPKYYNSLFNY